MRRFARKRKGRCGFVYQSKFTNEEIEELIKTLVLIDNDEDCSRFLEDICTVTELKSIAQRLHVAKLLKAGVHYADIVDATGASSATVSRVNRALAYGADGYNRVIEKQNEKKKEN